MPRHGNAPGVAGSAGREGTTGSTAIVARELNDEAVRHEAEALADFVARGGSAALWFSGKDLTLADRRAIILALHDLEDSTGDAA